MGDFRVFLGLPSFHSLGLRRYGLTVFYWANNDIGVLLVLVIGYIGVLYMLLVYVFFLFYMVVIWCHWCVERCVFTLPEGPPTPEKVLV